VSTLLAGLGIGLLLGAQVGPVSLLIVRTVLRGGGGAIAVGLAMAAAVALVDVVYAALGVAGAGRLLAGSAFRIPLGLVSATILVTLGARTLWAGVRARAGLELPVEVASPRRAFATALAATALNPLTIVLWTVSFPAAAPRAALEGLGPAARLLAGVAAGTLLWYCVFALGVALARQRAGPRLLAAIDLGTGAGLVAFGGLLAYRTVDDR
jgi:threonine/homoserine/homoserine lactone efflux protein